MNPNGTITPHHVRLDLTARDKVGLLTMLAQDAAGATGLDPSAILSALRKREDLGSTGVGGGIALPHAAVAGLTATFGLLIRLSRAIDYGAVDEKPVDIVFLVLTPATTPEAGLGALSAVARTLRSAGLLAALRRAKTTAEALALWGNPPAG